MLLHMENNRIVSYKYLIIPLLFSLTIGFLTDKYIGLASISYAFMVLALLSRHKAYIHAQLMISTMLIDYFLVFTLEVQRHAIATTIKFDLTNMQKVHIICSVCAALLYLPTGFIGFKRFKKKSTHFQNSMHRYLGMTTFFFRTMGFLTMFAMMK